MRNRNRSAGFGLILLAYQILGVVGVDRIPPVTLGVLAAQVAIYLRLFQPPWDHLSDACVSGDFVWTKKNWFRLLFASFEHGDDWHLYYNMVSFVWKGISLERRLGSKRFFCILAIFSVLVNIVYVMLAELASIYFDPHYHYRCAVGFSGVIFALKVVTTHYSRSSTSFIFGSIPIPSQYAVWSELILIHLLVPRSSFIGHLAGILVGLAYVYGPLQKIIDNLLGYVF
ncbi:RHBDD1 (predicted) [Pycnogonum litorale]